MAAEKNTSGSHLPYWLLALLTLGGAAFVGLPRNADPPAPAKVAIDTSKGDNKSDSSKEPSPSTPLDVLNDYVRTQPEKVAKDHEVSSNPQAKFSNKSQQKPATGKSTTESKHTALTSFLKTYSVDFEYLIVTVPDPVESKFANEFDATLDTVQRAFEAREFLLCASWLPWPRRRQQDGTGPESKQIHIHRENPGVLLFRKDEGNKSGHPISFALVCVVGESPISGIHLPAFTKALATWADLNGEFPVERSKVVHWAPLCSAEAGNLKIVAPYFSGSQPSLLLALDQWEKRRQCGYPGPAATKLLILQRLTAIILRFLHVFARVVAISSCWRNTLVAAGPGGYPKFQIITGAATALKPELFPCEYKPRSTVIPDEYVKKALIKYLKTKEPKLRFALLRESNTGFGNYANLIDPNYEPMIDFPFPISISQLALDFDRNKKQPSGLPYTDFVGPRFPVRNATQLDAIPPYDPETAEATAAANLREIFAIFNRIDVRYVGITATDARDVIFLAKLIRKECPNVLIFTTEPSAAFLHPDEANQLRGMLVGSTYPLAPVVQYWAMTSQSQHSLISFPTQAAQGIYNAIQAHFHRPDRMIGYHPPNIAYEAHPDRPPIWISVIGQGGRMVPLHFVTDYLDNCDARTLVIGASELRTAPSSNYAKPLRAPGVPIGVLIASCLAFVAMLSMTIYLSFLCWRTRPKAPESLAASPGDHQVVLTWKATTAAAGYNVYRARAPGVRRPTLISPTPITAPNFTDFSVTNQTAYYYTVKALDASGSSDASNEVSAIPGAPRDVLSGVVHLYPLDGNGNDIVGAANGEPINGPAPTASKIGGALCFNGFNQYVNVRDSLDLRFTDAQSFTLSVWVFLPRLPNQWSSIVTKSRDSAPWYGIYLDATNHWAFAGPTNIPSPGLAKAGVWQLLTAVQDGALRTRSLYVNDVLVATGRSQPACGTGPLYIGGAAGVSEFLTGSIQDVRICNRALCNAEVAAVYQAGSAPASTATLPAPTLLGTIRQLVGKFGNRAPGEIRDLWTSGACWYLFFRSVMLLGALLFVLPYCLPTIEFWRSTHAPMHFHVRQSLIARAAAGISLALLLLVGILCVALGRGIVKRRRIAIGRGRARQWLEPLWFVLMLVICLGWTFRWWEALPLVERVFIYIRSCDLVAGMSPLLPMGFLGTAAFVWAYFNFRQHDFAHRPGLTLPEQEELTGVSKADRELDNKAKDPAYPFSSIGPLLVVGAVAVAIALVLCCLEGFPISFIGSPSAEGLSWDYVVGWVFWLMVLAVCVTLVRFVALWSGLRRKVLKEILDTPMVGAFERLPNAVSSIWRGFFSSKEEIGQSDLALLECALPRKDAYELRWQRRAGKIAAMDEHLRFFHSKAKEYLEDDLRTALWTKSIDEAFGVAEPGANATDGKEKSSGKADGGIARESFVAIYVVFYLGRYFAQLRQLVWAVMATLPLLLLSASSYPFLPDAPRIMTVIVLFAVFAFVLTMALVQLNRNGLVSRITRTTPDRVSWNLDFVSQLGIYVLPIVAVIVLHALGFIREVIDPIIALFQ